MSTASYQASIRRWAPIAVVLAIVFSVLSFAVSKWLVQPTYTSTVTMVVQPINASSRAIADPSFAVTEAQTLAPLAEQKPIVQSGYRLATLAGTATTQQHIISGQALSESCQTNGISALFSCSVNANSAAYSARAANNIASLFIRAQTGGIEHASWSIQVVSPALVANGPSSPHATLNALVAFLLVLIIVLLYGLMTPGVAGRQRPIPATASS